MNDFSPGVSSDHNLLLGILALRAGHIDRDAFVDAIDTWVDDRTKSLGQILSEKGKLPIERQIMLEALVEERLSEDVAPKGDTSHDASGCPSKGLSAIGGQDGALVSRISTAFDANGDASESSPPSGAANSERYRVIHLHANILNKSNRWRLRDG
jgi:hypothetical protein